MLEKRLPAIVDRAAWEKITKEQPGIRWDSVENTAGFRGRPRKGNVYRFGGYKTQVREIIEGRQRLALRNKVKEEKRLEI